MPLPIQMAHELAKRLTEARKSNQLDFLRPDGKTQVTIKYDGFKPVEISKIVIATQHDDLLNKFSRSIIKEQKYIKKGLIEEVVQPIVSKYDIKFTKNIIVNGTGRFVKGGPGADTGITGRKIIVDTYGGYARHGGGAFSGKDPSKVDRSAAYMARYVSKQIVLSGLAERCELQLAYSIGVAQPVSIFTETFGTGKINDDRITDLVCRYFDFRPFNIIKHLNLKQPIYQNLAAYGHLGREGLPWETNNIDTNFLRSIKDNLLWKIA
jgi:S-adenosylmethionine synthetase